MPTSDTITVHSSSGVVEPPANSLTEHQDYLPGSTPDSDPLDTLPTGYSEVLFVNWWGDGQLFTFIKARFRESEFLTFVYERKWPGYIRDQWNGSNHPGAYFDRLTRTNTTLALTKEYIDY